MFGLLPPLTLSSPRCFIVAGQIRGHYPRARDADRPIVETVSDVPIATHRVMMCHFAREQSDRCPPYSITPPLPTARPCLVFCEVPRDAILRLLELEQRRTIHRIFIVLVE